MKITDSNNEGFGAFYVSYRRHEQVNSVLNVYTILYQTKDI